VPIEAIFAKRRTGRGERVIAGLMAAMLVAGHPLDEGSGHALRYDRDAIAAGEWWRLVTAHVAHLSWSHALLNAAALLLVLQIFRGRVAPAEWWLAAAASWLAIDAGLWWLEPQLAWYAGASGVLHGLFAAGLAGLWRGDERRLAVALAIGLIAKLAFEWWQAPLSELFAAPVITAAHRYGAAGGLIAAATMLLRTARR
jgi:rhomboid family GlyGly-CTERM serine protease